MSPTNIRVQSRIANWLKLTSPYWAAFVVWITAVCLWKAFPSKPVDPAFYETLNEFGKSFFKPEHDIPIYAAATVLAAIAAIICNLALVPKASEGYSQRPEPQTRCVTLNWYDVLVFCFIVGCVWIPDGKETTDATIRRDNAFHFDFYYMGPTQAFLAGERLGTDFYTQYQSGWTIFFSMFGPEYALDYAFVFSVLTLVAGGFYGSMYILCRKLGVSQIYATLGVLLMIFWQIYSHFNTQHWALSQSTVLRNPLFGCLALAILGFGNRPGLFYGLLTGSLLGLSFLFGTDTGLYSILAVTYGLLLVFWNQPRSQIFNLLKPTLLLFSSAIAVVFLGLCIASHGSLFTAEFWRGYFEVFYLYPSGMSAHPIASAVGRADLWTSFLFCISFVIYIVFLSKSTAVALQGKLHSRDLACAFLAVFGLGAALIFINRSYDQNLWHSCTPALVLLIVQLSAILAGDSSLTLETRPSLKMQKLSLGVLLVLAILLRWDIPTRNYPSLWIKCVPFARPPKELKNYSTLVESMNSIRSKILPTVGTASLAVVGEVPSPWLIAFELKPSGRYSPSVTYTHLQDQQFLAVVDTEFVLFRKGGFFIYEHLKKLLPKKLDLVQETEEYALYRKRKPSSEPPKRKLN